MVSTKFYIGNDEQVGVTNWAELAAVAPSVLWQLELEFLGALNWNVYVSNEEFFRKLQQVELELAAQQGSARGWLTYTELAQLIPSMSVARMFIQYSTVFAVSYAASVFTIAGAFLLASQVPGTSLYRSQTDATPAATTTTSTCTSEPITNVSDRLSNANETTDETIRSDDELMDRLRCTLDDMLNKENHQPRTNRSIETNALLDIISDHWRRHQQRNRITTTTNQRNRVDLSMAPANGSGEYGEMWPNHSSAHPTRYDQFMQWMKFI